MTKKEYLNNDEIAERLISWHTKWKPAKDRGLKPLEMAQREDEMRYIVDMAIVGKCARILGVIEKRSKGYQD